LSIRNAAAFLLPIAAASGLAAQALPPLHLDRIATYGWADLSDSTGPLSVNDRRLGAGVLGAVNGAVEGRDGAVYVVDPRSSKVVIFDRSGRYRAAFGGEGEGPGEFRTAARIASAPDGSMYVWDPRLKRISRFAPDGKSISQLVLPTAPLSVDFAIVSGRAWFLRLVLRSGLAMRGFNLATGAAVDSFAQLTPAEVAMHSTGNPGAITGTSKGEVVYAGPYPVDFRIWADGTMRTAGTNRFADAQVYTTKDGVHYSSTSVRSLAARPDGSYAVVYSTRSITGETTPSQPEHYWLEILDRNGTGLAETELTEMEGAPRVSATANGDLLLSVTKDFPQVWRVRVSYGEKGRE
jgi:hypothetical protein